MVFVYYLRICSSAIRIHFSKVTKCVIAEEAICLGFERPRLSLSALEIVRKLTQKRA